MSRYALFSLLFLMGIICISGCVATSSVDTKPSDDDLYLQSLEEFLTTSGSPSSQQGNAQFSKDDMVWAEYKIRSASYYNRVSPLKVSSQFELSKTSFLLSVNSMEGLADFMLKHPRDEQLRYAGMSAENLPGSIRQDYMEFQQNNQNFALFLIKTFDTNVCSAAQGKYSNITAFCKTVQ